ncbi:MAG: translation initiation factor IF-2 [Bacilli bacterium]|jgi:translation initiation factor IF-2|nr:translation initiation factor IF-2 [Bacilli bacterium]
MKVKEVLEILGVPAEDLLGKLSNVGIEADMETDLSADIIKKLGKSYKTEIKAKKVKKETKPEAVEEQVIIPVAVLEEKPAEAKIEVEKAKTEAVKSKPVPEAKPMLEKKKPAVEKAEPKQEKVETPKEQAVVNEQDLDLRRTYDDKYDEFTSEKEAYTRIKNVKKNKVKSTKNRQANLPQEKQKNEKILYFLEGMTVAKIADGLGVAVGEVVKKLILLGYMVSATQVIERDIVEIVALEFGYELKDEIETDITKFEQIDFVDEEGSLVERPPIVTIMGHVDHGKTTLLDTIRNAKVVSTEAGGITQHIGAYQVKKNNKLITFIDTPGHAAFTEMRARGAEVTDIVILVVAADDGVMPQTIEAIEHAKAAKVPIIVAINKMDKPQAKPDRVKQELASYDLVAEEWGGNTIFVPISALTGKGVEELLEMILLVSEVEQFKANPNRLGMGTVIEARLDKGRGVIASLLVKNGSLKIGDPIVVGNTYGKVRAMSDETKASLKIALPSKAVEVTGLVEVPNAGDRFMVFEDEKTSRLVAEQRLIRAYNVEKGVGKSVSLASLFDGLDGNIKELKMIIKGDVQGSIEALRGSLEKVEVEGAKIEIVRSAVGSITETDISLAIAANAIIIGFNVRPTAQIMDLAKEKGIEVRLYNIIYKVLEDIEAAMKGLLDPVFEEKVIGQAEVRDTFKASKIGTIAGCYITSGMIQRNCDIRLIRDSIVVYEGKLSSLKRFKDDVKEVKLGYECGMTIENFNDIKVGDMIEAYVMEKVK